MRRVQFQPDPPGVGVGPAMARGSHHVIKALLVLTFLSLLVGAAIFWLLRRKSSSAHPPITRAEFWVYAPIGEIPSESDLLRRMVADSPFPGKSIGTREGITMSDIRFHVGVVKREGNERLFNPETLADPDAELPPDLVELLSSSELLIRMSFIAEERMADHAHLQFITHAVAAMADLTNATLVYDLEAEKFYPNKALHDQLMESSEATRSDLQIRVAEIDYVESLTLFTRGMNKSGLPDLVLEGLPPDHRTLGRYLLDAVLTHVWSNLKLDSTTVTGYGDEFTIDFSVPRRADSHRGWVCDVFAGRKVQLPPT